MRGVAIPATQQTKKYMFDNQLRKPNNNQADKELVNINSHSSGSENLGHLIDSSSPRPDSNNGVEKISRNQSVIVE